jgi:hypothetical protein
MFSIELRIRRMSRDYFFSPLCSIVIIVDVVPQRYVQVRLRWAEHAAITTHLLTSYGAAMVGVATAKTPCGPYTYKGSWKPLGADSRDMGVFQDGKPGLFKKSIYLMNYYGDQMTVSSRRELHGLNSTHLAWFI